MHSKDFLFWLEKENLITISKNNLACFRKVFKECLAAKKDDVLIVCDNGYPGKRSAPLMAGSYYYAAKKLGLKVNLVVQAPKLKGEKASVEVTDAMKSLKRGSIIVLCLSHRLGKVTKLGKSYRRFASSEDHRFVSSPSLGSVETEGFFSFLNAINIDYSSLQKKAKDIKNTLDWGKEVNITTKKGTDLNLNIRGRTAIANDANYTSPGAGGNMPAGEVYIAPRKKFVNGKVEVDATLTHHWGTSAIKNPFTLIVEKGQVVDIQGGSEARILQKTLDLAYDSSKYPWGIKYLGELGIGINPNAKLVGATILDEKVLGTSHVAIGSNYWFGGSIYAKIHLDQVFKSPKIHVDNKLLRV